MRGFRNACKAAIGVPEQAAEKLCLARENFDGPHMCLRGAQSSGTTGEHSRRILKKARLLTRPTPAHRDAPFRGQGRSE